MRCGLLRVLVLWGKGTSSQCGVVARESFHPLEPFFFVPITT